MTATEKRRRLRAVLAGPVCVTPATVYDALSARVAESVGFEVGVLSGSVCSATVLAAPDIALQTLTEFADQVRRITRATNLSLVLDADHGYGNALNVMRTVEELEHAGTSALMVEDAVTPHRFGAAGLEVISMQEMTGKLRAALRARQDPSLVVIGRIAALKVEDERRAAERAKAYEATGVDALFITGMQRMEEFDAIRAAVKLPIVSGTAPALKRADLEARGVRLMLQGHLPVAAAARALKQVYEHLHRGGTAADLKSQVATPEEMDRYTGAAEYRERQRRYLS
jgi:carboxyvinyl-carboxyphosphonate phosphorylmutase